MITRRRLICQAGLLAGASLLQKAASRQCCPRVHLLSKHPLFPTSSSPVRYG